MNVGPLTCFKSLWFGVNEDFVYICTVAKSTGDLQAYESGRNKELYFFCEMESQKGPMAHKIGAKNNAWGQFTSAFVIQAADSFGKSQLLSKSATSLPPDLPLVCWTPLATDGNSN